jgi:hypothetical protein
LPQTEHCPFVTLARRSSVPANRLGDICVDANTIQKEPAHSQDSVMHALLCGDLIQPERLFIVVI